MVLNRSNLEGLVRGSDRRPFDTTHEMIRTAFDVAGNGCDYNKAVNLYSWMSENISYDKTLFQYRSASQAFRDRKGICVCHGFLYTTMARIVGLNSSFVNVPVDESGNKRGHACSSVYISGRRILVDTCRSNGFDIKHKKSFVWNDEYTRNNYRKYFEYSIGDSVNHEQMQVPFGGILFNAFLSLSFVVALGATVLYSFKDTHAGRNSRVTSYLKEKVRDAERLYDSAVKYVKEFDDEDEEKTTENEKVTSLNFRSHLEQERRLKFPLIVHRLKAIYPERDFSDFSYNQKNYVSALTMYIDHVRSVED